MLESGQLMKTSATMLPFNFNIGQLYRFKKGTPERLYSYMANDVINYDTEYLEVNHNDIVIFLSAPITVCSFQFCKILTYNGYLRFIPWDIFTFNAFDEINHHAL